METEIQSGAQVNVSRVLSTSMRKTFPCFFITILIVVLSAVASKHRRRVKPGDKPEAKPAAAPGSDPSDSMGQTGHVKKTGDSIAPKLGQGPPKTSSGKDLAGAQPAVGAPKRRRH